jgi:hypothetical protein
VTRKEFEAAEEDDWQTIAALLKAGCSMPLRLKRKYDAHQDDMKRRMFPAYYRQLRAIQGEQ